MICNQLTKEKKKMKNNLKLNETNPHVNEVNVYLSYLLY